MTDPTQSDSEQTYRVRVVLRYGGQNLGTTIHMAASNPDEARRKAEDRLRQLVENNEPTIHARKNPDPVNGGDRDE